MLSAGTSKSCCLQRGCNGPKLAPQPKPVAGRYLGHVGGPCQARAGDAGNGVVTGPIAVNPSMSPALDPVAAASSADGKAVKVVDRSKGLWTRCDKCGTILYIKHLKEHHHICFGCNYHLKAIIGFAGRRVIEQTLQEQLPDDFQVRRRWAQWSRSDNGNGKELTVASDSASVSYRELVGSFSALVNADSPSNGAARAAPLDLQALPGAMDIAKASKIEWMMRTDKLLSKQQEEAQYVFRSK
ncbi:Acetyl-coenzyme A carboxylase carboxyl transferase subunit beta, chloroplastic [Tetrabaena socialis]|uniref:Acetyl-coenzyme A carboxylase carboxyl transferase subunit beta, chloroplastic n=1 Tax=Tetrabaena socialis TaxID=47790 RepID=A0A2J8A667_9CHLO|nr:Acetyl-coenzyme A carboxylase carboxyl transferase subunit beta, chloroplastic [Tetrabaena socialis]|eukprot:PNH08008.1 Acetyl-coenzyme A carboxylase carboxyl transferase subunit beta, chloroplastic [Tetrabaena socialis]